MGQVKAEDGGMKGGENLGRPNNEKLETVASSWCRFGEAGGGAQVERWGGGLWKYNRLDTRDARQGRRRREEERGKGGENGLARWVKAAGNSHSHAPPPPSAPQHRYI